MLETAELYAQFDHTQASVNCLPGGRQPCNARCCQYGTPATGPEAARAHTLWDCSVAQAVVAQLQDAMCAAAPGPLARADVWLLRPPTTAANSGVWPSAGACGR
eukprot:364743-Chlamydomonas_euryale.AAC.115